MNELGRVADGEALFARLSIVWGVAIGRHHSRRFETIPLGFHRSIVFPATSPISPRMPLALFLYLRGLACELVGFD